MLVESLLKRCDLYLTKRRTLGLRPWSDGRLSTLLFNDGDKLSELRRGRDVNTRTFERAKRKLLDLERALPRRPRSRPCAQPVNQDAEASS